MGIWDVFKIFKKQKVEDASKDWYEQRYENAVIQRNIFIAFSFLVLIIIFIAVVIIIYIVNTKQFDPFVVQVEESTGIARVLHPITGDNTLISNDSIAKYFIKKYVISRETYNPVDFATNARKTVKILSSQGVYQQYLGYIKQKTNDPTIVYADRNTTYLTVRSWSTLDKSKYVLRFSIAETAEQARVFYKIAIIDIQYVDMDLTEEDRDINPIGFQVIKYRVDDDNS